MNTHIYFLFFYIFSFVACNAADNAERIWIKPNKTKHTIFFEIMLSENGRSFPLWKSDLEIHNTITYKHCQIISYAMDDKQLFILCRRDNFDGLLILQSINIHSGEKNIAYDIHGREKKYDNLNFGIISYEESDHFGLRARSFSHMHAYQDVSIELPNKIIIKNYFGGGKDVTISYSNGYFFDESGKNISKKSLKILPTTADSRIAKDEAMALNGDNVFEDILKEPIVEKAISNENSTANKPEEKKIETNDTADAKESKKLPESIPTETPQNDTVQPSPELPPPVELTPPSTSVPFLYYIAIALGSAICLSSGIYWKTKK